MPARRGPIIRKQPSGKVFTRKRKAYKVPKPPKPVFSQAVSRGTQQATRTVAKAPKKTAKKVERKAKRDYIKDYAKDLSTPIKLTTPRGTTKIKGMPRAEAMKVAKDATRNVPRKVYLPKPKKAKPGFAEKLVGGGVVGLVSPETSAAGRKFIYGTESPGVEQLAAGAVLGRLKVPAKIIGKATKAVTGPTRAARAAVETVKRGKKIRRIRRAQARKPSRTARQRAGEAKRQTKKVATEKGYLKQQASKKIKNAPRKAKGYAQRHPVKATTRVAVPAALAGTPQGRALVKGTVTADPGKTLKKTPEGIVSLLAPAADVALGAGETAERAAKTAYSAIPGTAHTPLPGGSGYTGREITAPTTEPVKALAKGTVDFVKILASGDAEAIRKLQEEEIGYAGWAAGPLGVKAVGKGLKVPAAVAKHAAGRRRVKRAKQGKIPSARVRAPRKVKQVVAGKGTRMDVSRQHVRTRAPHEKTGRQAAVSLLEAEGHVPKRTRKVLADYKLEPGDVIAEMVEFGITKDTPVATLRELYESSPRAPKATRPRVHSKKALRVLSENPEIIPDLIALAERTGQVFRPLETSPRRTYLPQGDILGKLRPEETTPMAARPLAKGKGKKVREKAWQDVRKSEARAKRLRQKGEKARAEQIEARIKPLREALDPYTRPGQSLQTATRIKWDKPLREEYVRTVKAAAEGKGLGQPVRIPHRDVRRDALGEIVPPYPTAGRAAHIKEGDMANIDRSWGRLVESAQRSHLERGFNDAARNFFSTLSRPVKVAKGKTVKVVTREQANRAIEKGWMDPRETVLLPAAQFKQPFKHADFDPTKITSDVQKRLDGEISVMDDAVGTKYIAVDREAALEYVRQITPGAKGPGKAFSAVGAFFSKPILGLSPAWAQIQVLAEGIQAAIGAPNLARWVRVAADSKQMAKRFPEEAKAWDAMAGESTGFKQPGHLAAEAQISAPPNLQRNTVSATRMLARNRIGRKMLETNTYNPLFIFDRWKGGKIASALAKYELDKGVRDFTRGVSGMTKGQAKIAKALEGKSRVEQKAWLSRNPKAVKQVVDAADDIRGNWNAFSRFEQDFAGAAIFYTFLRMSFRWALWTFPTKHPIKATIAYTMAQAHNDQVRQILGAEPASIFDLATAISYDEEGAKAGFPIGRRYSPFMNSLTEAIGEGEISRIAAAANPALGLLYMGISGKNAFGEEVPATGSLLGDLEERGKLLAGQLLNMPAPLRLTDIPRLGEERGPISQLLKKIDPDRALRGVALPFKQQPKESLAEYNQVISLLKRYDKLGSLLDSREPTSLYQTDPDTFDRAKKTYKLRVERESIKREFNRKLRQYDLDPVYERETVNKPERSDYNRSGEKKPEGKSSESGWGASGWGSSGWESGGKSGGWGDQGWGAKTASRKVRKRSTAVSYPSLDPHQTKVLNTVLRQGVKAGATRKELKAATETALVESNIRNLDYGDADSTGWRQERASIYGSGKKGPTNVRAAAKRFFSETASQGRGQGQSAGELAADVQRPREDLRGRYDENRAPAEVLLRTFVRAQKKGTVPKAPKTRKGKWGGSQSIVKEIIGEYAKSEDWKDKENRGTNSYHDISQKNAFAADLSPSEKIVDRIARKIGLNPKEIDYSSVSSPITTTYKGYEIQFLPYTHGSGPHVHIGARWTGSGVSTVVPGGISGSPIAPTGTLTTSGGKDTPKKVRRRKRRYRGPTPFEQAYQAYLSSQPVELTTPYDRPRV